jgi:hypothetical protein
MKLIKLRLLKEGKRPIVRITYKNFLGKELQRDAIQTYSRYTDIWNYLDNRDDVNYEFKSALQMLVEHGLKEYEPNKTEL